MFNNNSKNTFYLYIIFTFNNIFYIILDLNGKMLWWTSTGRYKTKGLKKITLNSIKTSLTIFFLNIRKNNMKINLYIKLKGFNKFKKNILKYLKLLNFNILSISDEIVIPHNGCRKKKKRKL